MDSTSPNEIVIAALTLLAGALTLGITLGTRGQIPGPHTRLVGLVVLYCGMAIALWAAGHLRTAIRGLITPNLDRLVTGGPYRFVRHPVYLGMTIALVGLALACRSIAGLLAVALVFVPVELHRAHLEEKALAKEFAEAWFDYASKVGFFLPRIGPRRSSQ